LLLEQKRAKVGRTQAARGALPLIRAPKSSRPGAVRSSADPANRPAFIHCASAIRVGAFWMIRRVLRDGWEFDKAVEEANRIGMRSQGRQFDFAKEYIAKKKK